MRVTTVEYSRLANLGNYEHQRVTLRADIDPHERAEDVLGALEDRCRAYLKQPSRALERLNDLDARWRGFLERVAELRQCIARTLQPWVRADERARSLDQHAAEIAALQGELANLDTEEGKAAKLRRELGVPRPKATLEVTLPIRPLEGAAAAPTKPIDPPVDGDAAEDDIPF